MHPSHNLVLLPDDTDVVESIPVSDNATTLLHDFKQAIGLLILLSALLALAVRLLAPGL